MVSCKFRPGLFSILLVIPGFLFAQPNITIDPAEINVEFPVVGERWQGALNIGNEGDGVLDWTSEVEIIEAPDEVRAPVRDNPGDLIAVFNYNQENRHCSPVGYDPTNGLMWITQAADQATIAIGFEDDYSNARLLRRINTGVCYDGAFARGLLFLPPFNTNVINRYDSQGQNIGAIEAPFPVKGIAADELHDWLFLLNGETTNIHVFTLTRDGNFGEEVGVIDNHLQYHDGNASFGIEWVYQHQGGQLWMLAPPSGRIYQIAVDTRNWLCESSPQNILVFPGGEESQMSAVAHDGDFFWAGGLPSRTIRVYDDGLTENDWLYIDARDGRIPSGITDQIGITLDFTDRIEGRYEAAITINSNAPGEEEVIVPLVAEVAFASYLEVVWSEDAGFPDLIDFNDMFGPDIYVNFTREVPLTVRNAGWSDLVVESIESSDEHFTIAFNPMILHSQEDTVVNVSFLCDEIGLYVGDLTVISDDSLHEELVIHMRAESILPPIIALSVDEIEFEMREGDAEELQIELSNDGASTLRWIGSITRDSTVVRDGSDFANLTLDPMAGEVAPGAPVNLTLMVQMGVIDSLQEVYRITILSNDPATPSFEIVVTITALSIEGEAALLPSTTELQAAFPNPFNSSTTIVFGLDKSAPTRIAVFGVDGRLVDEVVSGDFSAGYHTVIWNAEGFPAGSYLVKMEARGVEIQQQWVRLVK